MPVNFCFLAADTYLCPPLDVFVHTWPDILGRNQLLCCSDAWVGEGMHPVEHKSSHAGWHKGSEFSCGGVTCQSHTGVLQWCLLQFEGGRSRFLTYFLEVVIMELLFGHSCEVDGWWRWILNCTDLHS